MECVVCGRPERPFGLRRWSQYCTDKCEHQAKHPKRYAVVFVRGSAWEATLNLTRRDFSIIGYVDEISPDARSAGGDIYVHAADFTVVTDDSWLWEWEKMNPASAYAPKVIQHARCYEGDATGVK